MISRHDLHYQRQKATGTLAPQQVQAIQNRPNEQMTPAAQAAAQATAAQEARKAAREQKAAQAAEKKKSETTSYRLTTNPVKLDSGEFVDADDLRPISYSDTMLKQAEKQAKTGNIIEQSAGNKYILVNNLAGKYEQALDLNNNSGNIPLEFAKGVARVPSDLFRVFAAGGMALTMMPKTKGGVDLGEAAGSAVNGTIEFAKDNPAQFAGSVAAGLVTTKGAGAVKSLGGAAKTAAGKVSAGAKLVSTKAKSITLNPIKETKTAKQTAPSAKTNAETTVKAKFKVQSASRSAASAPERIIGTTQRIDKFGRAKPEGAYMRLGAAKPQVKGKREWTRGPTQEEWYMMQILNEPAVRDLEANVARLRQATIGKNRVRIEGPKTAIVLRHAPEAKPHTPKDTGPIGVVYRNQPRLTGEVSRPYFTSSELKSVRERYAEKQKTWDNLSDYEKAVLSRKFSMTLSRDTGKPSSSKSGKETGSERSGNKGGGDKEISADSDVEITLDNGMVMKQKVQFKAKKPEPQKKPSSGPKQIILNMEPPKPKTKTETKTKTAAKPESAAKQKTDSTPSKITLSKEKSKTKTESAKATATNTGKVAAVKQTGKTTPAFTTTHKTQVKPAQKVSQTPGQKPQTMVISEPKPTATTPKPATISDTAHKIKTDVDHVVKPKPKQDVDSSLVLELSKNKKPAVKEDVKQEQKTVRKQKRAVKTTVKEPTKKTPPRNRRKKSKKETTERKKKGKKPSFAIRSEVVNQFAWLEPDTEKKAKPRRIQK